MGAVILNFEQLISLQKTLFKKNHQQMYPYQEIFLKKKYAQPKLIVNKSRQIGMSSDNACSDLLTACFLDWTNIITAPSLKQSEITMKYANTYLNILREDFTVKTQYESQSLISFENGGNIYCLPNSPNTVRGIRAHHITIDEGAFFIKGTDKQMMTAILPSISRGGGLCLISNPFGTENVFYDIWSNPGIYSDWDRMMINWTECPDIDKKYIEYLQKVDNLTYQQEHNNQFLTDVDMAEFPFGLIQRCINMDMQYEDLSKNKIYRIGVDIGRRQDLTAIAVFEELEKKYYLRMVETMFNKSFNDQKARLRNLLNDYTISSLRIDETGIGMDIAETLRDEYSNVVRPVMIDHENKEEMILGLKAIMHDERMIIPNDPKVINNIRSIQRSYSQAGHLKFDSKRDKEIGHSDIFYAICLALYEEKHRGTATFYIE